MTKIIYYTLIKIKDRREIDCKGAEQRGSITQRIRGVKIIEGTL